MAEKGGFSEDFVRTISDASRCDCPDEQDHLCPACAFRVTVGGAWASFYIASAVLDLEDALHQALHVMTARHPQSEKEAVAQASAKEEAVLAARKALGMEDDAR